MAICQVEEWKAHHHSSQSAPGKWRKHRFERHIRNSCSFCGQTQLGDLLKGGFSEGWREFSGAASCEGCRVFIYCCETSSLRLRAPTITSLWEERVPKENYQLIPKPLFNAVAGVHPGQTLTHIPTWALECFQFTWPACDEIWAYLHINGNSHWVSREH